MYILALIKYCFSILNDFIMMEKQSLADKYVKNIYIVDEIPRSFEICLSETTVILGEVFILL